MNIGILSGTFDPVHNGHIELASAMQQAHELDGVVFVVERQPRAKQPIASYSERALMLELALQDYPDFHHFSAREPHHTLKTLQDIANLEGEGVHMHLIVGRDVAMHMPKWDDWPQIASKFGVIVADRKAEGKSDITHAHITRFDHPARSKAIRTAYKKKQSPEHIHPEVGDFIVAKKLYR